MKTLQTVRSPRISIFAAAALATALLSSARAADDCSPVRLDDVVRDARGRVVLEGSMAHVAVRDQKQIGSCYAHTSAQMYDAWRFRHGETDYSNYSSGFEVGQRFKIDENETIGRLSRLFFDRDLNRNIDGGFVKRLLPFLLREGTCSQAALNDMFVKKPNTNEPVINVDEFASGIMKRLNVRRDAFHAERDKVIQNYRLVLNDVEPETFLEKTKKAFNPARYYWMSKSEKRAAEDKSTRVAKARLEIERLRNAALGAGAEELKKSLAIYLVDKNIKIDYSKLISEAKHWTANEVNTVKLFELIGVIHCDEHQKMKTGGRFDVVKTPSLGQVFDLRGKPSGDRAELLKNAINDELDKGLAKAYPIGIAYCSAIFSQGAKYAPMKWDDKEDKCGRHASMIVGRRPDPKDAKACQFLIRNSWGNHCYAYSKDWDCEYGSGSVWVDADKLSTAIHDIQTIQPIYD